MRTSRFCTALVAMSVACTTANQAFAQTETDGETASKPPSLLDLSRLDGGGPDDHSIGLTAGPAAEILATEDGGKISLSWDLVNSKPLFDSVNNETIHFSSAGFRVERTVKGKTDDVSLFGLDGFDKGTTLSAHWTNYFAKVRVNSGSIRNRDAALDVAKANCRYLNSELPAKALDKRCDPHGDTNGGTSAFLQNYAPKLLDQTLEDVFPTGSIPFLGLEVSANQSSFEFVNRNEFKLEDSSKVGFSGTVFAGVLFDKNLGSLEGSFTYARSYSAASVVEICRPITGSMQLECIEGQDGEPSKTNKAIFAVQSTLGFADGPRGPRFGVSPKISTDVKNDSYAIDVPVYFIVDGGGNLSAGIRFGYTDKPDPTGGRKKDGKVGVFFGTRFGSIR